MLTPQSSHALKQQAAAFQAKAEKHARWGMILANAEEVDLAGEHLGRAERYAEIADALRTTSHAVANVERDQRAA